MSTTQTQTAAFDTASKNQAFAAFDLENLEILEIAQGVALPEMGASSGWIGTSSSSSSTCSAC